MDEGHWAIKSMTVRGAPAIAIVGMLSLAVELSNSPPSTDEAKNYIGNRLDYLVTSRPTAVNLSDAVQKLKALLATKEDLEVIDQVVQYAESMLESDVKDNMNIGRLGAAWISSHIGHGEKAVMMTHCNTGSLATAGYGTALGIIRSLQANSLLEHVYFTYTAPYNQGARLTAYELAHDKIPSTLITDSMASACIKLKHVSAIVVGADRVVANGDTANKIGTYQLAISAKYHGIPFIVAAPTTSIDLSLKNGDDIKIEERDRDEMRLFKGPVFDETVRKLNPDSTAVIEIPAHGTDCWNPSFDVTPASLITAIVTETRVFEKKAGKDVFDLSI